MKSESSTHSLLQHSAHFLSSAQNLAKAKTNAAAAIDYSTQSGLGALQGRNLRVGTGEAKQRAQAAKETNKGILSGLSNALKAVLLSPLTLVKAMHAYVMRSSTNTEKADASLERKAKALANKAQTSNTVKDVKFFLEQQIERPGRKMAKSISRALQPEPTASEKVERTLEDGYDEIKNSAKVAAHKMGKFFGNS